MLFRSFIKRWDNDKIENVIPYSPAGCEVIFSECVRLGYIEPKMEKPEVAEEPIESHTDSSTVQVANNSDSTEPQSSAPVTESERADKGSPIKANEGSTVSKKKYRAASQVQFCCGRLQQNIYVHRKGKMHLKSLETGVLSAKTNEIPRSD